VSVSVQQQIKQRLWRGYDDPGFPIGSYIGWMNGTGDVSGGDIFLQLIFEPEAQNVTGRYFNIEAIEVFVEEETSLDIGLTILGFSPLFDGAFTNRQITVPLNNHTFGAAAINTGNLLARPIFLGSKELAQSASIVQAVTNNSDGRILNFWLEGYIWDARSTQAPGGVRRPPDALYG